MKRLLYFFLMANSLWLTACSVNKQIAKQAQQAIISDSNFAPAHVGISIYDPSTNKYLYNYQGDKYFVPASNTKLLTCYAAMKHLGDSLVGLRYKELDSIIVFQATGDPTFLHTDFKEQLAYNFLISNKKKMLGLATKSSNVAFNPLGRGWAWDDYESDYMTERSEFPIYGNLAKFRILGDSLNVTPPVFYSYDYGGTRNHNNGIKNTLKLLQEYPNEPILTNNMSFADWRNKQNSISIKRRQGENWYYTVHANKKLTSVEIPFKTDKEPSFSKMLEDTIKIKLQTWGYVGDIQKLENVVHSQSTDSLLKLMMHRSDNFFAEQSLLMVSNETLGYMSDTKIIDSLLKTDFSNMPQKPKWVDGSGLSRYNLISPQDFVWLLNKMKQDFTWERISTILPTGDEGTLKGYYKNYVGKIYAKTGTLSNNVSLSGFITAKSGKQLIFSVLVNNHQTSATNIRRSVEKFLTSIIESN